MSGVMNIEAECLICRMSGVSEGQGIIGFLLSILLPFAKCESSHMLSLAPNLFSISLLSESLYEIYVPTNLQEQASPRIWSHMIIKYLYTHRSLITTEATSWALLISYSCLSQSDVSEHQDLNQFTCLFCRYLLFSEQLQHGKVLVRKTSAYLQELLHAAHCRHLLSNHLHNYDYVQWAMHSDSSKPPVFTQDRNSWMARWYWRKIYQM